MKGSVIPSDVLQTFAAPRVGPRIAADADAQRQAWQREMERAQLDTWFRPAPQSTAVSTSPADPSQRKPVLQASEAPRPSPVDRPASRHAAASFPEQPSPGSRMAPPVSWTAAHEAQHAAGQSGASDVTTAPRASSPESEVSAPSEGRSATAHSAESTAPGWTSSSMQDERTGTSTVPSTNPAHHPDWRASLSTAQAPSPIPILFPTVQRTLALPIVTIETPLSDTQDLVALAGSATERAFRATPERPPWNLHVESTSDGALAWIAMNDTDATEGTLLSSLVPQLRDELAAQGRHLVQVVCNGRLIWRDPNAFVQSDVEVEASASDSRTTLMGEQRAALPSYFFSTPLKDA